MIKVPMTDAQSVELLLSEHKNEFPIELTEDGKTTFVILNAKDYDALKKSEAELHLLQDLLNAETSVREEGWVPYDTVIAKLGIAIEEE